MPYRRGAKPRRYVRRRSRPGYKKVRRGVRSWKRNIPVLRSKVPGPYPNVLYTCLRYNDTQTLTPGSGSTAVYTYRINSMYDPNYTGAGYQPRYFDNLLGPTDQNAPYNSFRVHGAKVSVTFLSNTASTSAAYCAMRFYSDSVGGISSASSLTPATYGEVPWTKWTVCQAYNGSASIRKLSQYVKMNKLFAVKDISDMDELRGTYAANPTRPAYCDIYVSSVDGTSTPAIICNVSILYYVQLCVMNEPTAS